MGLIVFIVILAIYLIMPLPVQIIMFIGNVLMPDSVPVVDELIMIVGSAKKIYSASNVINWITAHKILSTIILIVAILLIINLIEMA